MQRSQIDSFVQEKPPRYTHPDPQTQAGRLQKQTDFLRFVEILEFLSISFYSFSCAHCFAPRTGDLYARYCIECGLPWQNLTQNQPRLNQPDGHSVKLKSQLNK